MSTPKKALLEPLRARVRRLQFVVGLGLLALMMGSVLSGALAMRLTDRVGALPFELLRFTFALVLEKLWVLAVLPLLCYGAARVLELRPWSTALGAALTGQVFVAALELVRDGTEGWGERGGGFTALEWSVLAVGVVLSQRAIVRGRAAALEQGERMRQQAAARQDEYAGFLREAEREARSAPGDEPKTPAA